ncbi:MAG: glycerol-3-phosphate dehydrogenase/oxidase [Cyclobacteriaceae bacterium]|nr:glycerol-3-phosphate dehydrogenase/oxidase [Cyclobacteriaceae bacterium]
MNFSSTDRNRFIASLKMHAFDVLVIGGGITGVGIALDAASRGLKVALVEKDDFASGTSSRSTKLIHGGLRYLKQFEFALVKEVGSERAVIHKLAPHLVLPEKMLLPLREHRGFGSVLTSLGLKLYDWLAGVTGKDRRLMLTRKQTLRREPLLKKDDVKGGALYAEYRTDDARLTIEVAKKANKYGAIVINYCKVAQLNYSDIGSLRGAEVHDLISDETFTINSRVVINATGPWVDQLRAMDKSLEGKRLHLTKGVHIVLPKDKLPIKQSIYFDIVDGRMIFAIPRGRTTYVGTTDTNYQGDIDSVVITIEDAQYLIKGINENFPQVKLKMEDIESSWAGLRPLIHEEGKSASALSRKDEIFISPSGLYSIAGGKLTGYRKMAERIVDMVIENNPHRMETSKCYTQKIRLSDGQLTNSKQVRRYVNILKKRMAGLGLDPNIATYLIENYGKQSEKILKKIQIVSGEDIHLVLLKAELRYCVEKEMTCSSLDFFIRRTGRLYFYFESVLKYKIPIIDELASLLNWSNEEKNRDMARLETALKDARNFLIV